MTPTAWHPVHRVFERWAADDADRPAVVDLSTGRVVTTYGALNADANRLARRLRRHGAAPGAFVGVLAERGARLITALLAVVKSGAAYVPLDPRYPDARLEHIVRDCSPAVVVGDRGSRDTILSGRTTFLDIDPGGDEPDEDLPDTPGPDDPMYVIHTSGSTGSPKGVVVPHGCVARLFTTAGPPLGLGADDVWTGLHSFAFDFSVWETWGALAHGGRLVVVPYETAHDVEALWELVVAEGVTVLNQTPSAFRRLMPVALRSGGPPGRLRLIVFGGEKLVPALLAPWLSAHGDRCPRLVNMYGITETTVHVTARRILTRDARRTDSPIGLPLDDLRVHVLDRDRKPTPPGTTGEMYVAGPGVARGYLNQPRLTSERFLAEPGGPPGSRMYRTGDLASWSDDGELLFQGRADRQVQVRGFRVEPGEVEAAVAAVPGVEQVAVVPHSGPDEEVELVAYVVGAATPAGIRSALVGMVPRHLVPSVVMPVPDLPLTAHGKLDTDALPTPRGQETPSTEAGLAELWAAVLGVADVDPDDDFFALGGDSLRAEQLVAALRGNGLWLDVASVYRSPTLREIAAVVRPTADPDHDAEPDPGDGLPLSARQTGILFDCEISPRRSLYRVLAAVHLPAPFDRNALRAALDALAARHDVLRTCFDLDGVDGPVHRVRDTVVIPLTVTASPQAALGIAEWDAFRKAWSTAVDPGVAPLLHCHVLLHQDGSWHLALVVHHALLDGWSLALLAADLLAAYDTPHGADPPIRAQHGTRHQVLAENAARANPEERAFWTRHTAGPRTRALPWQTPGPGGPAMARTVIPPGSTARIARLARALGVPVKTVCAAAHLRAIATLTGDPAPVVGLAVSVRPETIGSDLIPGMFVNLLPLTVDPERSTAWPELVREVFRQETRMLPHRWVPTADLVSRHGGRLFDNVFTYTDFRTLRDHGAPGRRVLSEWVFLNETDFPSYVEMQSGPTGDSLTVTVQVGQARPPGGPGPNELLGLITESIEALCSSAEVVTATHRGWRR